MEFVEKELRWVYKDFNFYPNKMRYGFRVNSYDIADIHSRFIKFICIRENIIKRFPYVNIKHKNFIYRKFDENVRAMLNRLNEVNLVDAEQLSEIADSVPAVSSGGVAGPSSQRDQQSTDSGRFGDENDGDHQNRQNRNSINNTGNNNSSNNQNNYRRRSTTNRRGMSFGRRGRTNYRN